MKKTTLLLTTFFIASFAINVFAQKSDKNLKPAYRNGGFWDHWYISAGAGGQMYFGEDDNKAKIGDRISPAFQLSAGKWINHFIGARIQVGGLKLKGWNDGDSYQGLYRIKDDPNHPNGWTNIDPQLMNAIKSGHDNRVWKSARSSWSNVELPSEIIDQTTGIMYVDEFKGGEKGLLYLQDMRYIDAHIDAMINLTSAIRGYSPTRFFNYILYGGVGVAYEYGTENGLVSTTSFIPTAGMMFNFRLSNAFDLGLDLRGTIVDEAFDSHIGGESSSDYWAQEGYASATLNLIYKFKQREFEAVYEMDPTEIQQLNDRINALMIPAPIAVCPECPPAVAVTKTKVYLAPVHFPLDVHLVQRKEMYKVELAAKFLTDDAARTLHLEGYADRKTGNPKYNQGISERRVREVRRILVEKYGIDPNRLTVGWQGDVVQPFDINELNRAVLFIGDEEVAGAPGSAPVSPNATTSQPINTNNLYK